MTGVLLSATGATRRFGPLLAVDAVDLEVSAGEVVGLVGANGAGKTTLIRLLLGLLHPSAGQVRLLGEAPSRRTRARLGYVPQSLGLYEDLTVAENLAFTAQAFGVRSPIDRGTPSGFPGPLRIHPGTPSESPGLRTHRAGPSGSPPPPRGPLADPELEAASGELVASLPLGLRRRLAFAAALGHRPELLVLDEPTSGVDALGRARLWDAIRSAAEEGAGVLVTTHSMGEAEQCDRLLVMAAGRVVARGTVDEIIGDATTVTVRGTHWADAFAACEAAGLPVALVGADLRVPAGEPGQVRSALEAAGLRAEVTVSRATLEEAFVLLAGRTAD
jgi:ABC-2 type transport system ATP-binding protein/ribosome-dependent ATPase